MNELPEVIYAWIIKSEYLRDIEYTWSAEPGDDVSRYVRDEVIGWEAVREQLPGLLELWGWESYPGYKNTFKGRVDDRVYKIIVGPVGISVSASWLFTSTVKPRSINDLKAILRSIDPALVGE